MVLEGREASAHHRKTSVHLHDTLDISDWVTRCLRNGINEFTARLQSGLAILASVGSTALHRPVRHRLGHLPRAGGHRHVRPVIHRQGGRPHRRSADHDRPGPGRRHPRRAGLQRLVRGNKGIWNGLNSFAHDVHAYFVTGARVSVDGQISGNVLPLKKGA
jgi:biopolymer transport protein ExbB